MIEDDEAPPPYYFFVGGIAVILFGVGIAVYGAFDASCLLGTTLFYGLSCIGGWVFLAIGFVLVPVGVAMLLAFQMED